MMEMFLYFWLNYSDENNHIERIPIAVKNIDHHFCMTSEIFESDKLYPFSFLTELESNIINT